MAFELSGRNQAIMHLIHQVAHLSQRLRVMRHTAFVIVDERRV